MKYNFVNTHLKKEQCLKKNNNYNNHNKNICSLTLTVLRRSITHSLTDNQTELFTICNTSLKKDYYTYVVYTTHY